MLKIDFGRSINPAFLVETPSLSPRLQRIIRAILPYANAFTPTRLFLSGFLLIPHTKDLGQQCIDLAYENRDWNELKPEMKKTAEAVARLAISLWFPYLYLVGSESYDLVMRLWNFDQAQGIVKSVAGIFLQSIYLVTLLGESPSWQTVLERLPLGEGKTGLTSEKALLPLAPALFSIQNRLEGIGILPLLFRNFGDLFERGFFTYLLLFLCRVGQTLYQLFEAQDVDIKQQGGGALLLEWVAQDLLKQMGGLLQVIGENGKLVVELVTLLFALGKLSGKIHYSVGATGESVKMEDVVGCREAKESIQRVIDQIQHPDKYKKLGLKKTIKGILFTGPPGVGKSMVAKAVATTIKGVFLTQSGSSFFDPYIGQSAKTVTKLFNEAARLSKKDPKSLVVLFIDEIDAIGVQRSEAPIAGEKEINSATNAFLTAMDDLPSNVIVIGATNAKPENLDPAFVRAGRFDKHITFELPTEKERLEILTKLASQQTRAADAGEVLWKEFAKRTEGWCFADFTNLMDLAALEAGYKNQPHITKKNYQKMLEELKKKQGSSGAYHPMYV